MDYFRGDAAVSTVKRFFRDALDADHGSRTVKAAGCHPGDLLRGASDVYFFGDFCLNFHSAVD